MIYFEKEDILDIVNRISLLKNDISGKNFLISGGDGFIGKYFQAVLFFLNKNYLKKPCKVCIVDLKTEYIINDENFFYFKSDILTKKKFPFKFNYIIHAAGIPDPSNYYKYPVETLLLSITATKKLLDLAKKDNSFFTFFSSSEIYGNPDKKNIPTKESFYGYVDSMGDRSCYDEGKRVGETLCYIYNQNYNLRSNVIRPFNIVGPGMNKKDNRVFPSFFRSIKYNKK